VFVETGIMHWTKAYAARQQLVIQQLLDCGIHGITNSCPIQGGAGEDADGCRYPSSGRHPGSADAGCAAPSAGLPPRSGGVDLFKYNHSRDLWPLNPKGEMIFASRSKHLCRPAVRRHLGAAPEWSDGEWDSGESTAIGSMAWT